jgi:hypothetical protein
VGQWHAGKRPFINGGFGSRLGVRTNPSAGGPEPVLLLDETATRKQTFPGAETRLVANLRGIRDDAAQVVGAP